LRAGLPSGRVLVVLGRCAAQPAKEMVRSAAMTRAAAREAKEAGSFTINSPCQFVETGGGSGVIP
jgi:hypothetical protein